MKRRKARDGVMRALYQIDLGRCGVEDAFDFAVGESVDLGIAEDVMPFAKRLLNTTYDNLTQIDLMLSELAKGWTVDRMSPIDRNIMRIAVCEMLFFQEEVPIATAINEAVEIAKDYGDYESPKFINGILGKLATSLQRKESAPGKDGAQETS